MKIYAANNHPTGMSSFIGKPVWVLDIEQRFFSDRLYYYRLYYTDENGNVWGKHIPAECLDFSIEGYSMDHLKEVTRELRKTKTQLHCFYDLSDIRLATPVEVYTHKDFIELLQERFGEGLI